MNFKPKSVFLDGEKNQIAIDAAVKVENLVGALRFWFYNVDPSEKGDVEEAFRRGMAGALTSFVRGRGGGFDILPSEVECKLVCLNRQAFEKRAGADGFLTLEKECKRALLDYFEENEEIGDFVLCSVISA